MREFSRNLSAHEPLPTSSRCEGDVRNATLNVSTIGFRFCGGQSHSIDRTEKSGDHNRMREMYHIYHGADAALIRRHRFDKPRHRDAECWKGFEKCGTSDSVYTFFEVKHAAE